MLERTYSRMGWAPSKMPVTGPKSHRMDRPARIVAGEEQDMTDRELLEAAYAAYRPGENYTRLVNDAGSDYWNPLTDDGDALRLAVKLREKFGTDIATCFGIGRFSEWETDPYAATRRAIVRAAAEIGRRKT